MKTALDDKGASAVEFALVLPAFLMLIVGGFYTALLGFTLSNMHFAAQAAARCASVKTTVCTNSTTTIAYAQSQFVGSTATRPTFTSTSATCGHRISATMTYRLDTGLSAINVPLSAAACFP